MTFGRYNLFTRHLEQEKTPEALDAALTTLAARLELETFEDELVRDLFIERFWKITLQEAVIFETVTPKKN